MIIDLVGNKCPYCGQNSFDTGTWTYTCGYSAAKGSKECNGNIVLVMVKDESSHLCRR